VGVSLLVGWLAGLFLVVVGFQYSPPLRILDSRLAAILVTAGNPGTAPRGSTARCARAAALAALPWCTSGLTVWRRVEKLTVSTQTRGSASAGQEPVARHIANAACYRVRVSPIDARGK
jgi:hypothetical protein